MVIYERDEGGINEGLLNPSITKLWFSDADNGCLESRDGDSVIHGIDSFNR